MYAPMIQKKLSSQVENKLPLSVTAIYFMYVVQGQKKRLIFFVTVPIDSTFKSFLVGLVGEQNIFTFSQYIERKID